MSEREVICYNLVSLNIADILVVGKVPVLNVSGSVMRMESLKKMELSELCARSSYLRQNEVKYSRGNWESVGSEINVFHNDSSIGSVDSYGRFFYKFATKLSDCLGWLVATDWGSIYPLSYDLKSETKKLMHAIALVISREKDDESWKEYAEVVRDAVKQGKGSQFLDTDCRVKQLFFDVGRRELGGM